MITRRGLWKAFTDILLGSISIVLLVIVVIFFFSNSKISILIILLSGGGFIARIFRQFKEEQKGR